ncbi:MAG: hypothetical protein ACTMIA_01010 [Vibrio sp.]
MALEQEAIIQLKQDFYKRISSLQANAMPQCKSTLSFLTDEELKELEQVWIELTMWKNNQRH